jgi:hypothetical protein
MTKVKVEVKTADGQTLTYECAPMFEDSDVFPHAKHIAQLWDMHPGSTVSFVDSPVCGGKYGVYGNTITTIARALINNSLD